mgnify:CR=1 FL=1
MLCAQAMATDTRKRLRHGKVQRGVRSTIRHLILSALSVVWLVPIVWLVVTSFSGYRGINFTTFFPETYTLDNYINVLFHPDRVAQFPHWFANTFIPVSSTPLTPPTLSLCLLLSSHVLLTNTHDI